MSAIDRELRQVWKDLRRKYSQRDYFLEGVNIRNMRGIRDLRVSFSYPVTVLAGENACGKTTVLLACAAAYKSTEFTPAKLFPSYPEAVVDVMQGAQLGYDYAQKDERTAMVWKRGKKWDYSFHGRKGAKKLERNVYLRRFAPHINPSEIRSMLQIRQRNPVASEVPEEALPLSRKVLPFEYESLRRAERTTGKGDLLLAKLKQGQGQYSEFHMAAGERSILRLSMELAGLQDALVLIDEVEVGLHPHLQKLLMLSLLNMALHQNLQVVVTTHSPVVLNCVPDEGRVFLSRDRYTHDVCVEDPPHDILQKVMYGQVDDKLSIICEDRFAEMVILGVVEALGRRMEFTPDQVHIGRDTGKTSFPNHVRTVALVDKLEDTVFVLDGDGRDRQNKVANAAKGARATVLVLPGDGSPEEWLWNEMKAHSKDCEELLSIHKLSERMEYAERITSVGAKKHQYRMYILGLAETAQCEPESIARRVTRYLAEKRKGKEITSFSADMEDAIRNWRRRMA